MKDKTVLLTGGTGGLGLGVTPAVLNRGAKALIIPYRHQSSIDRLEQKLSPAQFKSIRFVKADLTDENEVKSLIADLPQLDVLIHLVGGFAMAKTEDFSYQEWKNFLDLNLNTTFLLCKYCLKKMRQNGYGRIVTVGSRAAVQPAAQLAAYSAAKAGVVALTKAIAEETKDTDITANSVLPSVIDTPSNREAMGDEAANKWVEPESLAEVICFLGSIAAKDIRGAAVPVYGSI
ncbi:MAG: 3-oxoacyl-ACP reductase FabG [Prochloraceae cyanobacterium]